MTDREITQFLKKNGYPEHVVKGGRKALVEKWRKFVESVEKGYAFGLYDYRNDLDSRAILERLGHAADVADLDERLKKILTAKRTRIWESEPVEGYWNFGYPKNADGELREDLEAEGLLKKQSAPKNRTR